MNYEPKGIPLGKATTTTEGGCCDLCSKFGKLCKSYGYTYSTSKCQLYGLIVGFSPAPGSSLGYIDTSGNNFTRTPLPSLAYQFLLCDGGYMVVNK